MTPALAPIEMIGYGRSTVDRLALPYDTHPAFRVVSECGDTAAFDTAYREAEATGRGADHVCRALEEVFARLVGPDPAFLAELHRLVRIRLDDDLAHFAAQGPRVSSALDDRYYIFTTLGAETLASLEEVTRAPLVGLRAAAAAGKVTREDLSINTGVVAQRIVHLLDRDFEHRGVHDLVSRYARRAMRVSGVALELSVAAAAWWRDPYGHVRPPRTLYAHTDEGLANPKAIAYLTEVTPETGPMSAFPGVEARLELGPLQKLVGRVINSIGGREDSPLSLRYGLTIDPRPFASPTFRADFGRLPRALRYNSHVGSDVIPGSALEDALVAAEQPLLGPAGTMVVFDGARLLHRGGMVEHGERVALQIVFAAAGSRLQVAAARVLGTGREMLARGGDLDLKTLRRRAGRVAQRFSRHPHERLLRELAKLLPSLVCIDVGASYYPHPPWEVFQRAPRTTWLAVEPNAQNTAYLDTWPWPSRAIRIPHGLSERGGAQVLHVTATDSGSSLYPPVINADMAHRGLDHAYFFPVTEHRISTKSLDEIAPAGAEPVFVKLDTQGSELAILCGANALFDADRIVGIESEATLLARPVMVGSGKFWELCQFLETRGFELLQLKPIEGGPDRTSALARRTYLNECDAVFALTRSRLLQRPVDHQLAALGFYVSYHLYDEALTLFDAIPGIQQLCKQAGVATDTFRKLLAS